MWVRKVFTPYGDPKLFTVRVAQWIEMGSRWQLRDVFRPRWQHSDSFIRGTAVRRLTDDAILAKVAISGPQYGVRRAAVERLTDDAVLARVAVSDPEAWVRSAAVGKLRDQDVLGKIAKDEKNSDIQLLALSRLHDQSILAEITRRHKNADVRAAAVTRLTDQFVLAEVTRHHSDHEIRGIALSMVSDRTALIALVEAVGIETLVALASEQRKRRDRARPQTSSLMNTSPEPFLNMPWRWRAPLWGLATPGDDPLLLLADRLKAIPGLRLKLDALVEDITGACPRCGGRGGANVYGGSMGPSGRGFNVFRKCEVCWGEGGKIRTVQRRRNDSGNTRSGGGV